MSIVKVTLECILVLCIIINIVLDTFSVENKDTTRMRHILAREKVQVTSKCKEKPKRVMPVVHKGKEHIVYFTCNEKGHYNQCLNGRKLKWHKGRSKDQGGAPKVKLEVFIGQMTTDRDSECVLINFIQHSL